jgi:hypothetical protein
MKIGISALLLIATLASCNTDNTSTELPIVYVNFTDGFHRDSAVVSIDPGGTWTGVVDSNPALGVSSISFHPPAGYHYVKIVLPAEQAFGLKGFTSTDNSSIEIKAYYDRPTGNISFTFSGSAPSAAHVRDDITGPNQ